MTRTVHTGPQTVDATTTGVVDGSQLEKWEHRRTALRVIPGDQLSTDVEVALEVSVDGETWDRPVMQTGQDFDILREIPEPYVRANVTTAADGGTITLWLAASD
jgi:hypothetical protein